MSVFCPFAAGYFLSFCYRNVNAVISKDLVTEFALNPAELGFLTSMYLFAFAACQLPLGVVLDRYGPRRAVAALLCAATAGAVVFALGSDLASLAVGRALIGLGVSAGLMAAIKAFSLWFPLGRLATLNGFYLAVGGLGALAATAPAEALVGALGWRGLFFLLAVLSLATACAVFFVVPEKLLPGSGEPVTAQVAQLGRIFKTHAFWRIALPVMLVQGTYVALQGLWLGPWLYDVARLGRQEAASYLLTTALGYIAGSLFFGWAADRLAQRGVARLTVFKAGLCIALAMLALIAAEVENARRAILALYAFAGTAGSLSYALLTPLFPPAMTGRVATACNMLMFTASFALQWSIGAALKLYPVIDGRYSSGGYTAAFTVITLLQLAALAWLVPMRAESGERTRT